jgi:hypothetical protein
MRVRLFDCWMHELDIADALGRSDGPGGGSLRNHAGTRAGRDIHSATIDEGGPRAELAIDEIVPYLGRVLAKRGKAPDGSRITVDLTGPVTRTLHIRIDGRAELVPALDRPADVVIRLGSGLFARLCGGRTTAEAHTGEIELSGDIELGRRLVGTLAFTL